MERMSDAAAQARRRASARATSVNQQLQRDANNDLAAEAEARQAVGNVCQHQTRARNKRGYERVVFFSEGATGFRSSLLFLCISSVKNPSYRAFLPKNQFLFFGR